MRDPHPLHVWIGSLYMFGAWAFHGLSMGRPAYQKKTTSNPVSNAFSALKEDKGKPMDELVDGTRKKMGAPPRNTDGKSILPDLQESDDDVDVENGYDVMATYSKSLEKSTGGNT
ncbi:hypothetical protein Tco_0071035 [Tanacetum coccineum]